MIKLFFKSAKYCLLILIVLELIVRVLHLTKDYPIRTIDDLGVEKWKPKQKGFSVTGNRRQNFSEFRINNSGFNSYREFTPSKNKKEIAMVGDSFIEGFHQDYNNSIGKKIENLLPDVEVYEYGYAGYDFADQLHLIHQYQSFFDLIDHIVIGIKFEDDLVRNEYSILKERMELESPMYRSLRNIKLLVYLQNIGAFSAVKSLTQTLLSLGRQNTLIIKTEDDNVAQNRYLKYIKNFQNLVDTYGYDKTRFVLMLDKGKTPKMFLDFLDKNAYLYIDFSKKINQSKIPTTLIYDQHWNNHGRNIVASEIVNYFNSKIETD